MSVGHGRREGPCIMGNGHMGASCEQTDTHDWKHNLPATSLTGGNNLDIVFSKGVVWYV